MYLEMMYELLPYHYQSQEINRLTLAHFIISGLHFLGAIDRENSMVSLVSLVQGRLQDFIFVLNLCGLDI
ncbi:hypothetical protein ISN45_Aa07g005400 [Arabidopsis thaliana x Arabidopsis arenosa]|uniref:Uncharacterized protein n=1 Tax=Arabidopsis thaliana x Arabidopsis arenosa TaxID=1240361 RepID=A0A8T1Y1P0_9BRAS|nr:hypothetical protein ISN45_Aa07g005400 [Arabidopsis thaliana x Arabidopsis arenosa]